jgi:hypothetical protein
MGMRRAYHISGANRRLIESNFKMYREAGEPGIAKAKGAGEGGDTQRAKQLREKEVAEEPGTSTRTKMRRECNPKGPVGYMLETVHLQASAMDDDFKIHQQT